MQLDDIVRKPGTHRRKFGYSLDARRDNDRTAGYRLLGLTLPARFDDEALLICASFHGDDCYSGSQRQLEVIHIVLKIIHQIVCPPETVSFWSVIGKPGQHI